jgi:Tfp pilus assembly protein FimT
LTNVLDSDGDTKGVTMKKRTMLILAAVAVAVMAIAVPAFAQSTDQAPTQTLLQRVQAKVQKAREFPPEWINLSLDELKTKVQDRADQASQRIDNAPRLSDEQKTELQASIDSMLGAVDQADSNAEVAGTAISRVQLERQAFRAERNGGTPDYEAHIAGDIERAQSRMERLTKVAGWADIAGEDVTAINGYLDEASTELEIATGSGTVQERHDAVHIALAWETEAAAALDNL